MSFCSDSSLDWSSFCDTDDEGLERSSETVGVAAGSSSASDDFRLCAIEPTSWCVSGLERAPSPELVPAPLPHSPPCQEGAPYRSAAAAQPASKRARRRACSSTNACAEGSEVERESSSAEKAWACRLSGSAAPSVRPVRASWRTDRAQAAAVLVAIPGIVREQASTGGARRKPAGNMETMSDAPPTDLSSLWANEHVQTQFTEVQRAQPWSACRGKAAALEGSPFADHVLRSVRLRGYVPAPVLFLRVVRACWNLTVVFCHV